MHFLTFPFHLCVRYYKITDPGNWINVVENTGELKVANTIDRESPLVHKDMYNITIRAVDESEYELYVTHVTT